MMRSILLALALTLPAAAFAATPPAKVPAKPAAAAPAAAPPGSIPIKRVAMSQDGMAKVKQMSSVPDARAQQLVAEEQGLSRQKLQFLTGSPIDMTKLEALLRREEAILGELRKLQNDRLLTTLRALSESDRIALLQTVALQGAKPQGQPAAAAPTPSGR